MARSLGTLTLDIIAKTGGLVDGMSKAERATAKQSRQIKKNIESIRGSFALVTGAAIVSAGLLLKSALSEQAQLQANLKRTEQLLITTGNAAGFSASQLYEQARALALNTLQSTEGVMRAQQVMLTFRQVTGETFTRSISLAADLASVMGGDLNSAVLMLGKALQDPERGLTAMGRAGVTFSDKQKQVIKDLVKTGEVARAQGLILDEVAKQVRGVAVAEATNTLAGSQDTLNQRIQEAKIEFADLLDLEGNAISFYNSLSDATLFLTDNMQDVITTAETLLVVIGTRYVAGLALATAAQISAAAAAGTLSAALITVRTVFLSAIGPAGWIALAVGGVYAFVASMDKTKVSASEMASEVEKVTGSIVGLTRAQLLAKRESLTAELDAQKKSLESLRGEFEAAKNAQNKAVLSSSSIYSIDTAAIKNVSDMRGQFEEAEKNASVLSEAIKSIDNALTQLPSTPKTPTFEAPDDKKLTSAIDNLKQMVATLGMTSDQTELYKLRLMGASEAQLKFAEDAYKLKSAYEKQEEATKKNSDAVKEQVKSLNTMLATLGMTDSQIQIYNLRMNGASEAQLKFAEDALAVRDAFEKQQEAAKKTQDEIKRSTEQFASNTQNIFADFLFDPFDKGLEGMLDSFATMIQRMIAEAAAADIISGNLQNGQTQGLFSGIFGNSTGQEASANNDVMAAGGSGFLDGLSEVFSSDGNGFLDGLSEAFSGAASTLSDALSGIFSGIGDLFSSGSSGDSWASAIGSYFGGARAGGGPVWAGAMFESGEFNRPELLKIGDKQYVIPGNKGMVEPMINQQSGSSKVVQNFNINTPDPDAFRTSERQMLRRARMGLSRG